MREEDDGVLVVAEVFVLLEVTDDLLMVHLAGHEVPLDESASLVVALAGQLIQPGQTMSKEPEESES